MNASITGSLKRPHISAQVAANNLSVEGSQWRILQVNAEASPSGISLQDGKIINARAGQITFHGSVDLTNWSYTPSSPITATASAQQMPVAELQQLARVNYPVTGYLSANLNLRGTQLNPVGQGSLQLTKATAYDQPIQNLSAQFQANGNAVDSTLTLKLPAGSANAHLIYHPDTRAYDFQMKAPAIALQQLEAIQAKNIPLNGTLSASASGSGTVSNPQLTATIEIPTLQVRDTAITGMRANLHVANQRAAFDLGSDVAQATVRAHGTVDLTGNYYADATLDTSQVPVTPLLAAYVSNIPTGAQGQVELHASIKGPLKDKARLQAHVEIPTLSASYQKLQISNSGPIRADYTNGILVLQPAELKGTDTALQFQGRIPVQGAGPMNVTAKGSVNLRLASMFASDFKTAGVVDLDVRGTGTPAHPGVTGQVRLQKVALTATSSPVGLQNLNGLLNIDNGKILISQFSGEAGGGQISAGGSITYEPRLTFNMALNAKGVRVLYPDGVRTVLDSELTLAGAPQASDLTGRVLIDSLSFTPDFDLASFMNQTSTPSLPPTNPGFQDRLKLNIAVQSTSDLSAVSSEVSIEGNANLQIIGTAANPVITGRADLNSGEVFFMKQRYQIERGIINFVNPNRTEPNVNILITTVVQQYNLNLTIVGPVDKLRTSYTSDPPLPPVDIINLIARGQTTEESAPGNFSANEVLAGELASQVSGRLGKFAGISSLTIDPLLGGSGTDPSARIAVQQRVTRNFIFTFSTDVTNPQAEVVQGEYQVNKNWGVSATRDQYGGFAVEGKYRKSF
jgi:translocation and assembly module TamB